jgi:stage V sporulation protein AD
MQKITYLDSGVYIRAFSSVGGFEEGRGPLGEKFDLINKKDLFGMKTWERAEGEMSRLALNIALKKASLSPDSLNLIVAGDLQNQCVATSFGLASFGIPYLGVYGACSTCTESLLLSSTLLDGGDYSLSAAVTSSHNSTAERQFRTPIEYGGQRTGTAQWTATAAGAFILTREKRQTAITEYMIGKIISGETSDATNMGGAMAFAAADTILTYFKESGASPADFDHIVTGDLGKVGSNIIKEILSKESSQLAELHTDCGLLLYDEKKQDMHSGASGCGTSASVLAAHFLPQLESGKLRRILFLSTGALMNPSILLQGQPILGIAPLIKIEGKSVLEK